MFEKKYPFVDKRRFKRLDQIFPVEFRYLNEQNQPSSDWFQGFTQDVSEGGLCLIVCHLKAEDLRRLEDQNTRLSLAIHIPIGSESVAATARPAWVKGIQGEQSAIGISYEKISAKDNRRILRYVGLRSFFKAVAIAFSFFLSLGLVFSGFYGAKLRLENEKLIVSFSANLSRQQDLMREEKSYQLRIDEMEFLLSQSGRKIENLQGQLLKARQDNKEKAVSLSEGIDFLRRYQEQIKTNLSELVAKKARTEGSFNTKAQEVSLLEEKIMEKFFRWLRSHQNNRTGLVISFEGDDAVADWGFTYDQALAAIVFIQLGDPADAKRIFDFYTAVPGSGANGFADAYYASTGDVAESMAHAGPNIWLGVAVLRYTEKTNDRQYLDLARRIAQWLEILKDSEGGLRGGQSLSWYSTEHNLDAYAFYSMLFVLTNEENYRTRSEQELLWLNKNVYSNISSPIVKRGKGDATIATDTYAWSITAIGPKKLKSIGMDPDRIMDFAIDNCRVSVNYQKPQGESFVVKGFDFAKHQNLARGGVVSCEWTAQMILAFKIMADYHKGLGDVPAAQRYRDLADFYTCELVKMTTTSPSPVGQGEFCLPYASCEFADTGHGWRTPKGNRTGSVAATAYAILAIDGFNPLKL